MYYKVIKNNSVIDALDTPSYVCRNLKNGRIMRCSNADDGLGVLSHSGAVIYQIEGKQHLHGKYDVVKLEEISESEYLDLRSLIDGIDSESVNDGIDADVENDSSADKIKLPMSIAEMREKIIKLEEQLAEMSSLISAK